ncbi:MAG: ATPase [Ruminococcus sp.]|jgi:hypothetical protein|nr:ATPase [Ruminococcus sp.]
MEIDDILDTMDELLDKAAVVPFTVGKVMVNKDRMTDCINNIRLHLPSQFKSARMITQDRNEILRSANSEAERIIKQAEERAKVLVSNDEITKTAKIQAADITKHAEERARQVKVVVDSYIERVIGKSEESLRISLEDIRKTKSELKGLPLVNKKSN